MKKPIVATLGSLCAAGALAAAASSAPRIRVGPNVLVSRDGDVPHCEMMVAANPRDPKNLLGASITLTRPSGGAANKAYVSFDGGATWTDVNFPEELQHGGGDPQVGFGISGTAYFIGLSDGMNFYRSEDGGRTWGKALLLGRHHDHEMLVVDQTSGRFAGRIYLTDETEQKGSNEIEDLQMKRRVVLFRSSDDGRSFVGPVEVAVGNGQGIAAENLLVLSDGTLFIPMIRYPNYAIDKKASTWKAIFSLSSDGGVTFSSPQPIAEIKFGGSEALMKSRQSGRTDQFGGPVFAVDNRGSRFRDRLYAAWTDWEGGRLRLVLTRSSDRGKTWSKPRPVDPASEGSQFQPVLDVNNEGTLGVFWYDTAGRPNRDGYDVYFAASIDGGETFLPKSRVSTETSAPVGNGNLRPGPFVSSDRGMVVADFLSGYSRWPNGGDYMGLTTDGDGLFHPFWSDARTGTFQVYSAAIRVETGAAKKPTIEDTVAKVEGTNKATAKPRRIEKSLADKITLSFDPVRYVPDSREVFLPVRLKNTSKERLYPPFRVEVKETVHPYEVKAGFDRTGKPEILNAVNGKNGVGAQFDYSKALGDLEALEPEATTNAVVWRLKVSSPARTDFHFGVDITGFVEETKESQ